MKKLKASEITEPGLYWEYINGIPTGRTYRYLIEGWLSEDGDQNWPVEKFDNSYFIKAEPTKVCRWKSSEGYDGDLYYETECDNMFAFIEGDLKDNEFEYCSYCGGHIELEESEG